MKEGVRGGTMGFTTQSLLEAARDVRPRMGNGLNGGSCAGDRRRKLTRYEAIQRGANVYVVA